MRKQSTIVTFENVQCPVCYAICNVEIDLDYYTMKCKHFNELFELIDVCTRCYDFKSQVITLSIEIGSTMQLNDVTNALNHLRDMHENEVVTNEKETKFSRQLRKQIDLYYTIQQIVERIKYQ